MSIQNFQIIIINIVVFNFSLTNDFATTPGWCEIAYAMRRFRTIKKDSSPLSS